MRRWIRLIFLLCAAAFHHDLRGSTVALTDDNANVTDRMEYSAYGLLSRRAGSTDTPFLYCGRQGVQTEANGLHYMRARYYNPYLCRFLNADPSGFAGGLNLYAYANGNPVSYLDPSGLGAVGGLLTDWIRPPSPGADMTQIYAWLGGGGTLPYSVSFPFGDVASVLVPGYSSFGTASAAFMAGDYRTAAGYGILGVAEVGVFIGSMGGSEGASLGLNVAETTGAENVVNGVRLNNQLTANEIAGGHAFDKHVVQGGEFPGITTSEQFSSTIENIINNASDIRILSNGRTAYWDDASQTVVIRNPSAVDGGTAFKPNQGKTYFNNLQ
jgi:RHS repeat-associated protein